MSRYIVGIDSGTTSIKAVLFDDSGREVAKHGIPLTAITPCDDRYEEDMDEIWDKCCQCVAAVTAGVPRESVVGIGVTAQGDGMWLVDDDMRPVAPGACFCDGRAAGVARRWEQEGVTRRLFDLTGTWLCVGNQNCVLKWFDENEPETLDRTRWILHLKDYLFYKLTHEVTTDATDQSLVFLDHRTRDYLPEAFEICGLAKYRDKYPPILPAGENAFPIAGDVARALGVSDACVVTSGPMDVAACALGAGVVERGACCSIIGTAGLHEMVIDRPNADDIPAGMTVAHAPEGLWLRLMASYAGAPNTDWALRTLGGEILARAMVEGVEPFSLVEKLIRDVPIGSNGVIYHPYLLAGGERAPFTDPHARASYTGISVKNDLADLLHATYEGVAFAMLDCYRSMPMPVRGVTLCGGGARSAFWCQMFADAVGAPVRTVEGDELGARGAMINNAVAQGFFDSYAGAVGAIVSERASFSPDPTRHKRYEEYYELYRLTYESLADAWDLRARLIGEGGE